jgi:hypothetical protein
MVNTRWTASKRAREADGVGRISKASRGGRQRGKKRKKKRGRITKWNPTAS